MIDKIEIKKHIYNHFSLEKNFIFDNETRPSDVPGWDSLGWMSLIVSLESNYNVRYNFSIFDNVETVMIL